MKKAVVTRMEKNIRREKSLFGRTGEQNSEFGYAAYSKSTEWHASNLQPQKSTRLLIATTTKSEIIRKNVITTTTYLNLPRVSIHLAIERPTSIDHAVFLLY